MTLALGVDTGGTFTDAVLIRDEREVIASAKALTTRQGLAIGVGNAVQAVLEQSGVAPGDIGLAALSTTLATNALVEGQGGRVGLIYVGFDPRDLNRHGLEDALKGDPVLFLGGGHDHAGQEAAPLDVSALLAWLETHSDVSAFAVAAQFATRNPAHEAEISELLREKTGRPVSCSHHLSARLNGPKRALTALLNARLIGMIDRLIGRAEDRLRELGILAPMMVVRGDGALIGAEMARERPIETILSGPAASIVGASWLTGARDALVSDIGGTTTDVALLRDGRPKIDPDGARVGPFRTMVEAVAMRTSGLGGDSEVHFESEGLEGGLSLGPRRLVPVSLLAHDAGDLVHRALEEQLRRSTPSDMDARFVRRVDGLEPLGLSARDLAVFERISGLHPVSEVLKSRMEVSALRRLQERGYIQIGGVTPTDAAHVLGLVDAWDCKAAETALGLFGRRRGGSGNMLAPEAHVLARMIIDQLEEQTSLALLETAFAEEGAQFDAAPEVLARHELLRAGLSRHQGLIRIDARLNTAVIGLGASAASYYPAVGEWLGCDMILPEHAEVANAVGAVVGRITMRREGTVTSPTEGLFRVHGDDGPKDFNDSGAALAHLEALLRAQAEADARASGAGDVQISTLRDVKQSAVEGRDVFIEAVITVEASGRPRIADDLS
ncbi:hydantoinase/oxoprolinase family protein [Rhodobacteraceae bacterium D3-12]|nr:hydantoinase/oxoprolinase family protein [Rhodobacteraceae bacterium D3-12]